MHTRRRGARDAGTPQRREVQVPAAPALALALAVDVDHAAHAPVCEEGIDARAHVLDGGAAGGDDVDYALQALFWWGVGVVVGVFVFVGVIVIVMGVRIVVVIVVAVVVVVVGMAVAVIVTMTVVVSVIMPVVMIVIVLVRAIPLRDPIVQPKPRHCITSNPSKPTDLLQRVSHVVLHVVRDG